MTGICTMRLRLPGVHSLKAKRKIIRSLVGRLRHRYNLSAAEVASMDIWQEAVITVAHVCNDTRQIERVLTKATRLVEAECEIIERDIEIIR